MAITVIDGTERNKDDVTVPAFRSLHTVIDDLSALWRPC